MSTVSMGAYVYDVVVVGGGAAGVGVSVALKDAGVENFVVLERFMVGSSFLVWPDEMRFITPSFPTNAIGMLDLNAVVLGTSPANLLEQEHPTGKAYAVYLSTVAQYHELPISENIHVQGITRVKDGFRIDLGGEVLRAKHVIWAAGEFQYPRIQDFEGAELCQHTSTLVSYRSLPGDDFIIIGGYESGIDAAYHLASRGKNVRVLDQASPWKRETSDPSVSLSTHTRERMREPRFGEFVYLLANTQVMSVTQEDGAYIVTSNQGRRFRTSAPPILATGFDGSHVSVAHGCV